MRKRFTRSTDNKRSSIISRLHPVELRDSSWPFLEAELRVWTHFRTQAQPNSCGINTGLDH